MRVIDLSLGPVGGLATTVLGDFGADIVKVERPGGDPFRSLPSWPLWLRGKRSVEIDLGKAQGRELLARFIEGADVLVSSFSAAREIRFGVDFESLSTRHPKLIHVGISGLGPRGPDCEIPGYEGIVTTRTGRISAFKGQKERVGPTFAALGTASHAAAQGAVQGILAALLAREYTGHGSRVETSLAQGTLPYDLGTVLIEELGRLDPENRPDDAGLQMQDLPTLNYHPVQCRDGQWIQLGNLLEHLFLGFLEAIDLLSEFMADEEIATRLQALPSESLERVRCRILERMLERDADEWMEIFRAHGGVAAEIWKPSCEALQHPDLVDNGDVVEHTHPDLGRIRQIGPIAQLERTPGRAGGPAPGRGEHSEELESESLPRAEANPPEPPHPVPPRGRPLDGITVIELGTIIAAPLGVSMLADLGARVIKVEALDGDPFRHFGQGAFRGLFADRMNQGKESICLDLKSERGQEIVARLVSGANALVHNFRPGVPERLGVGYEHLCGIRPDLVWVSANGYGPAAGGAKRPATHPVAGAAMGGAWLQAGAGMPPSECSSMRDRIEASRQLMKANEANPDPNTAVIIASATLLALLAQRRFGIGQAVYVNMLTANAWANSDDMLSYAGKADRPRVDAELRGLSACYRFYPTRDGWVFLALVQEGEWKAFCSSTGRSEWLSDPRFRTREARHAHDALASLIEETLAERIAKALEGLLLAVGVACVVADDRSPADFLASDSQALENDFSRQVQHPRYGKFRRWGPLVTCDGGMDRYEAAPLAGQHGRALLEELGYTADEIEALDAAGVAAFDP